MRRFLTLVLFTALVCNSLQAQYTGGNSNGFARSGAVQSSLPLTILSFTATTTPQGVDLVWVTEDESDTEIMTIERSANGSTFAAIGSLPAAGHTRGRRLTYSFTDTSPLTGNSYYRLRVVDFDGSVTRSTVVSVSRDAASTPSFSLYPNPTNGRPPTLSFPDSRANGSTHVTVYDLRGRKLLHFDLPGTGDPAQLPALSVGTYHVQLRSADGTQSTQTLLVTPAP